MDKKIKERKGGGQVFRSAFKCVLNYLHSQVASQSQCLSGARRDSEPKCLSLEKQGRNLKGGVCSMSNDGCPQPRSWNDYHQKLVISDGKALCNHLACLGKSQGHRGGREQLKHLPACSVEERQDPRRTYMATYMVAGISHFGLKCPPLTQSSSPQLNTGRLPRICPSWFSCGTSALPWTPALSTSSG